MSTKPSDRLCTGPDGSCNSGMSSASGYINLILKVTRHCNLHCEYCGERRDSGMDMPFPVLAHLTAKALRNDHFNSVNFIWHGGEPLLRGLPFYEKAVQLQNLGRQAGQKVSNSIQTNGVLLDESWAVFLKEHGFEVGVSLDGPALIHNAQRPTVQAGDSHTGSMKALELLSQYGIPHGVLLVVTDRTLDYGPERMFEFLVENNIRSVGFQQLRTTKPGQDRCLQGAKSANYGRYADFMKQMFDLWLRHDDPNIHIREFDGIMKTLIGNRPSQCTIGGACLGKHVGIDTNGNVYHCDRYVDSDDYLLGNIEEDDLLSICNDKTLLLLKKQNELRITSHAGCKWFEECYGGCPQYEYGTDSSGLCNELTCDTGMLFSHIHERLSSAISAETIPETSIGIE